MRKPDARITYKRLEVWRFIGKQAGEMRKLDARITYKKLESCSL